MDDGVLKDQALTLWMKGQKHHLRGDFNRAIEFYTKSLALYPTAEAYTFRGWAYSFQGRLDEAIDECMPVGGALAKLNAETNSELRFATAPAGCSTSATTRCGSVAHMCMDRAVTVRQTRNVRGATRSACSAFLGTRSHSSAGRSEPNKLASKTC
jgi:hypothetical protein